MRGLATGWRSRPPSMPRNAAAIAVGARSWRPSMPQYAAPIALVAHSWRTGMPQHAARNASSTRERLGRGSSLGVVGTSGRAGRGMPGRSGVGRSSWLAVMPRNAATIIAAWAAGWVELAIRHAATCRNDREGDAARRWEGAMARIGNRILRVPPGARSVADIVIPPSGTAQGANRRPGKRHPGRYRVVGRLWGGRWSTSMVVHRFPLAVEVPTAGHADVPWIPDQV